jgi:hypothetical protein
MFKLLYLTTMDLIHNEQYSVTELKKAHTYYAKKYGMGFIRILHPELVEYSFFASIDSFGGTMGLGAGVGTHFDEAGEIFDVDPEVKYIYHSFVPIKPNKKCVVGMS